MALPAEVVETFPEEIRSDPSWEKFNDVPSIAKSYVELQKMNGNALRIPDENTKPEDVEKWKGENLPKLAARGIIEMPPSKAEDYKLPSIDGFKADDALVNSFVENVALKTKMTPSQFEAVVAFQHNMMQEYAKNFVKPEAADAEFKNMLGNDYVPTMELVNGAMSAMAQDYPQFGEWSKSAYIVNIGPDGKPGKAYAFNSHPMVRGMYEQMGLMSGEDSSHGGSAPGGGKTKDALRSEIDQLMATPKFKAGDEATVAHIDELRKQLHGTAEV